MIEVMKTGKNIILFCLLWSHVAMCLPIAEGRVDERHVLGFSDQKVSLFLYLFSVITYYFTKTCP